MPLPPHPPNTNLHTLQYPLRYTRFPIPPLIPHRDEPICCFDAEPLKCAPGAENRVGMERDHIGDAPHEGVAVVVVGVFVWERDVGC